MLLPALSFGQSRVEPLIIGDKMPDVAITHVINYTSPGLKLSSLHGKMVILDFWATWCSSCLKSIPKMEALQAKFTGRLQVLGVAYESKKKITSFLNSAAGTKYRIASVVNDTLLSRLFPHTCIPHCVWIDGAGTILAITDASEVTAANIEKALSGQRILAQEKIDLNLYKPLFLSDALTAYDTLLHYSVFTKGWHSGLPTGNVLRKAGIVVRGQACFNSHLLMMYTSAAIHIFDKLGETYCEKRSIINVADRLSIESDYAMPDSVNKAFEYNYELMVPLRDAPYLYDFMLQDLNQYTGYSGSVEKRPVTCLVLVRTDSVDQVATAHGAPQNTLFYHPPFALINYPVKNLINTLNSLDEIPFAVLDGTGYKENIDIRLSPARDVEDIRSQLHKYGLDLVETVRNIYMFVLTDKPVTNW